MNIKAVAMRIAYAHLDAEECDSQAADKLALAIEAAMIELAVDHDITGKERDLYLKLLRRVMEAVLEFAAAFQPIIPQEGRPGWDAAIENIKAFEQQIRQDTAPQPTP